MTFLDYFIHVAGSVKGSTTSVHSKCCTCAIFCLRQKFLKCTRIWYDFFPIAFRSLYFVFVLIRIFFHGRNIKFLWATMHHIKRDNYFTKAWFPLMPACSTGVTVNIYSLKKFTLQYLFTRKYLIPNHSSPGNKYSLEPLFPGK